MDPMNIEYHFNEAYAIVDSDSDPDRAEDSSEDDIEVLLHGTLEQRKRLRRRSLGQKSSSSEDEFEKEMREELDNTVKTLHQNNQSQDLCPAPATASCSASAKKALPSSDKFYDQDYFDSDSDEEETSNEKASRKHPVPSNDDLLYDPNIDDENQKWIDRQRRKYQPKVPPGVSKPRDSGAENPKPLPHSDAVLNCPACMTVLCLDCQRHSTYKNQYRAMFVMNCKVDKGEVLKYPLESRTKKNKAKKQKLRKEETSTNDSQEASSAVADAGASKTDSDVDVYHPVRCSCCTTEVGVCDKEELYHFFNVLASYS